MRRRTVRWTLVWLALGAVVAPSARPQNPIERLVGPQGADEEPALETAADTITVPRFPPSLEVASRSLAVADSAELAIGEIDRILELGELEERIAVSGRRQEAVERRFADLGEELYVRPDQVSRIQDDALTRSRALAEVQEGLVARIDELAAIRETWTGKLAFWRAWRDTLRSDPVFEVLEPEVESATEQIETVLSRVSDGFPDLLAARTRIRTLREESRTLLARAEALRARLRDARFQRTAPTLFSRGHLADLREDLRGRIVAGIENAPGLEGSFLRDNAFVLLLQLVAAVVIALLAIRSRRRRTIAGPRTGVFDHPFAIGVFVSLSLSSVFYSDVPPVWNLVVASLLAASGAVLASRMFIDPRVRRAVYAVTAFYPLFLLLELIDLPSPVFRPLLAGAALGGIPFALALARAERREGGVGPFTWALYAAAVVAAAVLAAEVAGYDAFARWVVQAAVSTAFVAFVVALLVLLARAAVQTVVRSESKGRLRFLRRVGYRLAERVVWLIQAVLVFGAVLFVLDVWELSASPVRTWDTLTGAGVTIGGFELTIGKIVAAGLAIYVAVLLSWIVRGFLEAEVYERRELDIGVGDAISTLVNYILLLIGFFAALAAVGVELQSFAIVAGALGVGIGFGLQNVVNNFVSGLILLFERPVRVGDTVVVGGEWGRIRKIGLRSTVVETLDQAELIVPNGDLVSEKVTNWTLSSPKARLIVPVGVAYGSDHGVVKSILLQVAADHPKVLEAPIPEAFFVGFGDSSLNFELRVWMSDLMYRFDVRSELLAAIDLGFRAAGVVIPFPQRDLHLRSVDRRGGSTLGRGDLNDVGRPDSEVDL